MLKHLFIYLFLIGIIPLKYELIYKSFWYNLHSPDFTIKHEGFVFLPSLNADLFVFGDKF